MSGCCWNQLSLWKLWIVVIMQSVLSQEKVKADLQDFLGDQSQQFRKFTDEGFHNDFKQTTSSRRDYVITHPARQNSDGVFISHDVTHFIDKHPRLASRRKRDAESGNSTRNLYFSIDVDERRMVLNVTENSQLVPPDFVVERFYGGHQEDRESLPPGRRSSLRRGTLWPCHFRGHVMGFPHSTVAISTCNGLSGLIRLQDADYFIEPLDLHHPSNSTHPRAHKIYKRDATGAHDAKMTPSLRGRRSPSNADEIRSRRKKSNFCGVTDSRRQYRRAIRRRRQWENRRSRSHATRKKRSLSLEHWVEMMVVVDPEMVEYYENEQEEDEVERYVLTVINMVSELFHDVSIGNSIHITLIRLIILQDGEESLRVESHAEKTLDNFCRWAKRMNPQHDQHANHHDVAVLLTRHDLCSNGNKSCDTLGLAHVAGMCQPHRSCNVNQDTGLSLAFTVAHELGHNFAMHHDGQLNDCEPNDDVPHVMAPHLTSNNLPIRWSTCSRRYITRFLDRNWGFCLMDRPSPDHDQFNHPIDLPGVLYDADHQCRFMFGPQSRQCIKKIEGHMCTRLWCLHRGTCRTRLHSAVPGTSCASNKWCYDGACVAIKREPTPVDGSWGPWTHWSRCSRTCGVGVSQSARYCNQPPPKHGGKYCLGERRRYRTCNVWSCPKSPASFRTEQCAAFNSIPHGNQTYKWLPVDSSVYPCELHCYTRDSQHPFADRLRDKVVDGTKCFSHGNDICVDGVCKRLGCDLRIDSLAMEDRCGVCRGDGSSCFEFTTNFTLAVGDEYVPAGIIPKGASRIRINEVAPSGNFLALRSARNASVYFLNGNYMIQHDYQFDLAGTVFNYKRINKTIDNITADGPITHDVVVMLLYVEENPGINISYIFPYNVSEVFRDRQPIFTWMMQPWSDCSRTCGKGIQISLAICVEKKSGLVEEDFCGVESKPKDNRRACLNPDCPPEWYVGPWQPCSITCGSGVGRQQRAVLCVRSTSNDEQIELNRTECNDVLRPEEMRSCSVNGQQPCPMWKVGPWSECSQPCDGGRRNRSVKCVTYIINDVIDVADDVPNVSDVEYGLDDVDIFHDIARNTISRITIVDRRLGRNLLEEFDYETEEDDLCDRDTRPVDGDRCNNNHCPQFDRSISRDFDISRDLLMTMRVLNSTSVNNPDVDGDRRASHGLPQRNESFSSLPDFNDSLDQIVPTPVPTVPSTLTGTSAFIFNEHSPVASSSPNNATIPSTITTTTTTTIPVPTLAPKWLTGAWGQCSTTCGVGARIRNVLCSAGTDRCASLPRPAPAQRCRLKPCAIWLYTGWTKCSRMCGEGRQRRKVECRGARSHQLLRPFHCSSVPRLPRVRRSCHVRNCQPWRTSRWSRCSVSCGSGIQRRRVACLRTGMCDSTKRPVTQKNCMLRVCVEWRTYHWGRCPVNCGHGIKRRIVRCQERESGAVSSGCNPRLKPPRVKKCNKGPCRVTDFDFSSCAGDRLKAYFCDILRRWGKCVQPSIAIQCCRTCRTYISVRRRNKIS